MNALKNKRGPNYNRELYVYMLDNYLIYIFYIIFIIFILIIILYISMYTFNIFLIYIFINLLILINEC